MLQLLVDVGTTEALQTGMYSYRCYVIWGFIAGGYTREYMISHQTDVRVNENRVNEQGCFLARKQMYDNSCGAASLLCAAKELGVDKIPQYKGLCPK